MKNMYKIGAIGFLSATLALFGATGKVLASEGGACEHHQQQEETYTEPLAQKVADFVKEYGALKKNPLTEEAIYSKLIPIGNNVFAKLRIFPSVDRMIISVSKSKTCCNAHKAIDYLSKGLENEAVMYYEENKNWKFLIFMIDRNIDGIDSIGISDYHFNLSGHNDERKTKSREIYKNTLSKCMGFFEGHSLEAKTIERMKKSEGKFNELIGIAKKYELYREQVKEKTEMKGSFKQPLF